MKEDPRQCWRTPRRLAAALVRLFDLDLDIAANAANRVCPEHWGLDVGRDATREAWPAERRIFCNPPFALGSRFAPRALEHRDAGGFGVWLIIDRGTEWLESFLAETRFYRFKWRVQYEPAPGVKASTVTFGSVLGVWGDGRGFGGWMSPLNGNVTEVMQ